MNIGANNLSPPLTRSDKTFEKTKADPKETTMDVVINIIKYLIIDTYLIALHFAQLGR